LGDKGNKLSAMRSDQMTSRSRQVQNPPGHIDLNYFLRLKESMMTSRHAAGGIPTLQE
jgi:uncharacterized protein (UPF0218 family)